MRTFVILMILASNLHAKVLRTGYLVTQNEPTVIRTQAVRHNSCDYLKLEVCQRTNHHDQIRPEVRSCVPLLTSSHNAISMVALTDEIRDEHLKGWGKGLGVVALTVFTGGAAEGLFGFTAVSSAGMANFLSVAPLALAGSSVVAGLLSLPEFVERVSRLANPFYNGAVIKVFKSSNSRSEVSRLIDVNGLVRQRASITRSLKLQGVIRDDQGRLCNRGIRI
jgi:hypothetical protein